VENAETGEMEDLAKWRTWGNGGPGEMEDLVNEGSAEMENLGKWRIPMETEDLEKNG
jgi:hypothetical protein